LIIFITINKEAGLEEMFKLLKILFVTSLCPMLFLVGMHGMVLCAGDDGHMAVESSLDYTNCNPTGCDHDHGPTSEGNVVTDHDSCCGDCSDVILSLDLDTQDVTNLNAARQLDSVPMLLDDTGIDGQLRNRRALVISRGPPGIGDPALHFLRTVILLT